MSKSKSVLSLGGDLQLFTPSSKNFEGFTQDAFLDKYHEWDVRHNDEKREALMNNVTTSFLQGLYQRLILEKKNVTISIDGKPRTGKSGFGMGIGKIINHMTEQKESINDILFTDEQLKLNQKKILIPKRTIIIDEDFRRQTGLGITSINEGIDMINQMIGIEQINLIFIGVESQTPNVYCRFETINYNRKTQTTKAYCKDNNGRYWGVVYIPAYFYQGYEKVKLEFTHLVKQNQTRVGNEYVVELAYKVVDELVKEKTPDGLPVLPFYSQEAIKGYIRMKYASEGLQENQLYAVFSMVLLEKKKLELKMGIKGKIKNS